MKNTLLRTTLVLSASMMIVGCGGDSTTTTTTDTTTTTVDTSASATILPVNVQTALDAPLSNISQEVSNTLAFMGNEERLAYDVYNRLFAEWGTPQFQSIAANSEYQHIVAVQKLVQKYKYDDTVNFTNVDLPSLGYMTTGIESMQAGTYDISEIQKLYDDLTAEGLVSEIEALKVGCMIEVVDVEDLDRDIALAQAENATDIVTVFDYLRTGSYSHYWTFDAALKTKGMSAGCCTWAEWCRPQYPQNATGRP